MSKKEVILTVDEIYKKPLSELTLLERIEQESAAFEKRMKARLVQKLKKMQLQDERKERRKRAYKASSIRKIANKNCCRQVLLQESDSSTKVN